MGRKFEMKKISLNTFEQKMDSAGKDYQLDPTEEYVINLEEELSFQLDKKTDVNILEIIFCRYKNRRSITK